MVDIVIFCVGTSHPQNFLDLLLFFYQFIITNFYSCKVCVSKKVHNFLGSYSGARVLHKQLQLPTVEAQKCPKIKLLVMIRLIEE